MFGNRSGSTSTSSGASGGNSGKPMDVSRRVVVSGCGVVSPLGVDIASFDKALFQGRSAVRAEPLLLPGVDGVQVPVARCTSFDEAAVRAPSRLPLDRGSAMALHAANSAWADAGLSLDGDNPHVNAERLGVFWGSGMGGAASFDANCRAAYAEGRRMRPTAVVTAMPNAALAELALRFGARGTAMGYACACASAAVAIGEALRALRDGRLDVAVVGGSEALLSPAVMGAWHAMRVLAPVPMQVSLPETGPMPVGAGCTASDAAAACKPFDAARKGFALGEGAAAFVIETEAHARRRGVQSRLRLSGFASTCDAMHMTQPDPRGQARAMRAALQDAGLVPADIGHVNAHGTATGAGDAAEAESLGLVFGSMAQPPAVTATKAITGHLLGAGGALELLATLRALHRQAAPPTAHLAQLDPAFGIDVVHGSARALPGLRHAISNSFAFGGTNAVLVASQLP